MTPSLLVLLVANALPIVGVLVLGWTVFPLVLLYWLENVIVGGFNVAKLLLAQPREPAYWAGKLPPCRPPSFGILSVLASAWCVPPHTRHGSSASGPPCRSRGPCGSAPTRCACRFR